MNTIIHEIRIRETPYGYSPEVRSNHFPKSWWMAVNGYCSRFACNNTCPSIMDAAAELGRFIGHVEIMNWKNELKKQL